MSLPSPWQRVETALRARGIEIGSSGKCLCPGHDDREESLSVREAEDGQVLLHCFAGCKFQEIMAALGLKEGDAFPETPISKPRKQKKPKKVHATREDAVRALL